MYINKILDFRVIDGDTVDVTLDPGHNVRIKVTVRLAGINCEELRSKDLALRNKAAEALFAATRWLGDHCGELTLHSEKLDKYRRSIGHIRNAAGESLSDHLLSENLAKPYTEK